MFFSAQNINTKKKKEKKLKPTANNVFSLKKIFSSTQFSVLFLTDVILKTLLPLLPLHHDIIIIHCYLPYPPPPLNEIYISVSSAENPPIWLTESSEWRLVEWLLQTKTTLNNIENNEKKKTTITTTITTVIDIGRLLRTNCCWLTGWLTEWLADWLTDNLINPRSSPLFSTSESNASVYTFKKKNTGKHIHIRRLWIQVVVWAT